MNIRLLTGSGLAVAVVLFFTVNVLSHVAFRSARVDLTEQRLYTLTEGSRNILQGLDEPVTLRLYLSKKLAVELPGIQGYTNRVLELVQEYEQAAGGNLILHVIDPEPFSEEEDRAVGYGLRGVPLDAGNTQFYFGLVGTNATDDRELIPFFQQSREEFLEYDLTKLVYRLGNPKQKVVGLLSTLPVDGGPQMPFSQAPGGSAPWMIMDSIRELMEVKVLDKAVTEIPEAVDVLMVVHPKRLGEPTLYAIDQFVLRGGRAVVFVDPHSEADRVLPNPSKPHGHASATQLRSRPGLRRLGHRVGRRKSGGRSPLSQKSELPKTIPHDGGGLPRVDRPDAPATQCRRRRDRQTPEPHHGLGRDPS